MLKTCWDAHVQHSFFSWSSCLTPFSCAWSLSSREPLYATPLLFGLLASLLLMCHSDGLQILMQTPPCSHHLLCSIDASSALNASWCLLYSRCLLWSLCLLLAPPRQPLLPLPTPQALLAPPSFFSTHFFLTLPTIIACIKFFLTY